MSEHDPATTDRRQVERLERQVEALRVAVMASSALSLQAIILANAADPAAREQASKAMDEWLVKLNDLLNAGPFLGEPSIG